ncbi:TPA: hypothetical protein U1C81_001425 [Streptococcus suis]|uniref:DUF7657 domain-containing protein n=1 Tax=Streptococcus suis TaxID=1307 RepID=UPI001ABE8253|nr:hypothetical protein [Streptococcus suis]MBO4108788.1 hypothetical protein [Streptococcus suis]HEM3667653.1 hypothetical protein [Streptococcus suis]HEM3722141.1 hypothetical protein [Streptococcus suis]
MKQIVNKAIDYRYIIACIVFILGVSLELHGSSIANWNNFGVRETIWGIQSETQNDLSEGAPGTQAILNTLENWISIPPKNDGTIIGTPRMIRTDEWQVQAPFYLSQAHTGNQSINSSYAPSGQSMLLAYNAPMWHSSILGKPFNWGFLLLGAAKGMAWYWCFKIIGFLLLGYEFSMILTKRNKFLSIIGSFWITFTPAIQWWFMQHLGDVVFFSLLMMVSIYHFFHAKSITKKSICAVLLSSGMIGFTLVIYPAFQVPFAYLVAFFFIVQLLQKLRKERLSMIEIAIMVMTLLTSLGIIGYTLWENREAISLTLNTVYPGSRVSVGGDISLSKISEFLYNFILPFKIPNFLNQVELSSAIHFTPLFAAMIPFIIKRQDVPKNIIGLGLFVYSGLLAFYSLVGLPTVLSKITLFSFVTGNRSWQAMSVIGVFASIWFISYIWERKLEIKWLPFAIALTVGSLLLVPILHPLSGIYVGWKWLVLLLFVYMVSFVSLIQYKSLGLLLLSGMIIVSGMTINPVVHGLGVIENKALSVEIEEIVEQNPDELWITDNSVLYQYAQIFGAKSLDGVRFYPDTALMKSIDVDNKFENEWNRYAHVHYTLTDQETMMSNPAPDNLQIDLNIGKLDDLGVRYIISNRDLNLLFGEKFQLIYGPDLDGNRIYQFN